MGDAVTHRNGVVPGSATPAQSDHLPRLITLTDSLVRLSITQNTAYHLIARDEFPLPLVRIGRRWFVRSGDLDALVGVDGSSP
jgi:predicted DNA-binding transcriptional regulator AlpA